MKTSLQVDRISKGKKGENRALEFFQNKGYRLLERNWRYGRTEVDLILAKGTLCLLVEVKYRETQTHGLPEEGIGPKKIKDLMLAAENFWDENPQYERLRIDVLSIYYDKSLSKYEYFHIEDIYI